MDFSLDAHLASCYYYYDAWPLSFRTHHCSFTHSSDWYKLANKSAATSSVEQQPSSLVMTRLLTLRETLDHLLRKNLSPVSTCSSCKRLRFNPPPPTPPLLCTLEIVLNLLPALPIPLNEGLLCNKGGFVDEPPEPTRVKPAW